MIIRNFFLSPSHSRVQKLAFPKADKSNTIRFHHLLPTQICVPLGDSQENNIHPAKEQNKTKRKAKAACVAHFGSIEWDVPKQNIPTPHCIDSARKCKVVCHNFLKIVYIKIK